MIAPEFPEQTPWTRAFPRGVLEEAWAARHALRAPPRRFLVFAQGRTGSTLLTTLLDSHPSIRCEGELLERPRLSPTRFIENRARGAEAELFGFHVKCYQLAKRQRLRDLSGFLSGLRDRGWSIVHLWRENVFRQVVSTMYAKSSGRHHFRDSLAGLDHASLNYERDLADPAGREAAMGRIQDFLGVAPRPLVSGLRKAVNRPLTEVVLNYADVARDVARSRFAAHLPAEGA